MSTLSIASVIVATLERIRINGTLPLTDTMRSNLDRMELSAACGVISGRTLPGGTVAMVQGETVIARPVSS